MEKLLFGSSLFKYVLFLVAANCYGCFGPAAQKRAVLWKCFIGIFNCNASDSRIMGASQSISENSIHEFTVKDTRGKDVNLNAYRGKVLLVINVASKCGFADANYNQLTQLYTTYKSRGLEILAFPCNQFLKKEPGTSQEAQEFACTRYKAEYPIFGKIRVNGSNTAPVFKFLKAQKSGFMGSRRIKWNFTKFLIDQEGRVIHRYSPTTKPLAIQNDIKKALRLA
ncbi:hypothetical protein VNO78_22118 [Psophocarpus tetragonolobus]|uniref:Glutathione peroxidase n=1 Tax=Psophocarpus tetragonolobus TaxID=3891 RepID=A0AAN9SEC9_PSOTE